MIVGIKDASKFLGISIIVCCAVMVCTMFLNFYFDILEIESMLTSEMAKIFYNAQVSTAKVICYVTGGCLLITSVIMLFFYIKHYIDTHKKELGILKALGYSNLEVGRSFWVFGSGVCLGAIVGFAGAFCIMPFFYELQNKDKILPEIAVKFHPELVLYFVILPTIVFAMLAVFYAMVKLKRPVLTLLCDDAVPSKEVRVGKDSEALTFLAELKFNTLRTKKTLVFFVAFAAFCFAAMTQMSASMKTLSSVMMGAMILLIGIVLACTTMFLAITTVVRGNKKTIVMMRAFGYSRKECGAALLGCYRPVAYMGFAVGTVYQYILLRLMVDIVFKDIAGVPVYEFDYETMLISLAAFILLYEGLMYFCSKKISRISIKEIMLD